MGEKDLDFLIEGMINEMKRKFNMLGMEMPSDEIFDAFRKVKRHYFTPEIYEENGDLVKRVIDYKNLDPELLKKIYTDLPLAIMAKNNEIISTSSQPFIMSLMLKDAKIKKGNKVLEIGTGSGYNAGIIANICGNQKNVVTIEINKDVTELAKKNLERANFSDVTVINDDGGKGHKEYSPYDNVIITCGSPGIPKAIIEQTSEGGTLSLPLVTHGIETLCSLTKEEEFFKGYLSLPVRFLHFEGIYPDNMQFAKKIESLQGIIERYGKRENDIEDELKDILLIGNEDKEEERNKRIKRLNFEFFLAISRPDATSYESDVEGHERGYGLWYTKGLMSDHGLVIMFNKEIVSWGKGSKKVIDSLIEKYETWKTFEEPGLSDYILFFYPGDSAPASGYNEWQVKRRTGTTAFKLKRRRPEHLLIDANH